MQMVADGMTSSESRDYSIHPEHNKMFYLPGYNPCNNPSCRMHSCDQGIFKQLFAMIRDHVMSLGRIAIVREFESRFAHSLAHFI